MSRLWRNRELLAEWIAQQFPVEPEAELPPPAECECNGDDQGDDDLDELLLLEELMKEE